MELIGETKDKALYKSNDELILCSADKQSLTEFCVLDNRKVIGEENPEGMLGSGDVCYETEQECINTIFHTIENKEIKSIVSGSYPISSKDYDIPNLKICKIVRNFGCMHLNKIMFEPLYKSPDKWMIYGDDNRQLLKEGGIMMGWIDEHTHRLKE